MRTVNDPPRTIPWRARLALGVMVAAGCAGNGAPAGFPSLAGASCYRLTYADSTAAAGLPEGIALQGTGDGARAIWLPGDHPVWMSGWAGQVTSAGTDSLVVLYSSPRHYSRLELRTAGDRLHGRAQGGGHTPLPLTWIGAEGVRFACGRLRHPAPVQSERIRLRKD